MSPPADPSDTQEPVSVDEHPAPKSVDPKVESPPLSPVADRNETGEAGIHQLEWPGSDPMDIDSDDGHDADHHDYDQQPPPYSPVEVSSELRRSASRVPSEPAPENKVQSRASSLHPNVEPDIPPAPTADQQESTSRPQEDHVDADMTMEVVDERVHKSATPAPGPSPGIEKVEEATMSPLDMFIHPDPPLPLVHQHTPSEYVLNTVPSLGPPPPLFVFKEEDIEVTMEDQKPNVVLPRKRRLYEPPTYALPPVSALPMEFHKKGKPKQSRKREKDKGDGKNQEWTPMGIAKWGAMIRANPVYKRVSRATKCLSSRDWDVSFSTDIL